LDGLEDQFEKLAYNLIKKEVREKSPKQYDYEVKLLSCDLETAIVLYPF
jgi:hypothetical protein